MPSFGKIIVSFCYATAFAVAAPTTAVPRAPMCPEPGQTARVYASALYTLFPGSPQLASQAGADFHVQWNNQTGLAIQQAIVFSGFPAEAQGCAFGWAQDNATEGVLVAGGDGLLTGRQLAGFPINQTGQGGISAAAVLPFDTAGPDAEFHPDFTSWDREIRGTTHTSGPGKIVCAEDIYLLFEKVHTTNGNVFLKKTDGSGVFIDYTCS
ncbi:hypothetical protein F4677DRAFT_413830 [Hypoxylon crocopeplum]|nr:hypothetical protein F4677DRAFT_413830 [Hypoxylon crocopeplum]